MPWGQAVQTGPHSTTRYWVTPNDKKLVEVQGSIKLNDWNVTFYVNEFGKFEAKAARYLKKRDRNILTDNSLEIKLETTASIPKIIPIERQKAVGSEWKHETFIEINDGKNSIVSEFNEYQDYEPYTRKYFNSSIVKAYDFIKAYLPEFEELIKDKTVADHCSKIVKKAEQI